MKYSFHFSQYCYLNLQCANNIKQWTNCRKTKLSTNVIIALSKETDLYKLKFFFFKRCFGLHFVKCNVILKNTKIITEGIFNILRIEYSPCFLYKFWSSEDWKGMIWFKHQLRYKDLFSVSDKRKILFGILLILWKTSDKKWVVKDTTYYFFSKITTLCIYYVYICDNLCVQF